MENFEIKNEMIEIAKEFDIPEIIKLQQKNFVNNLSDQEKKKEGFTSLQNTPEELKEIIKGEGIVVVDKQNNSLAGYVFSIKLDYAKKLEFFKPLVENLKFNSYKGEKLDNYKCCILGQICVKKDFKGKGVAEKLISVIKEKLIIEGYDLGITEISEENPRSFHKNIDKIGMKNIGNYIFNNKNWFIVVLDLKE